MDCQTSMRHAFAVPTSVRSRLLHNLSSLFSKQLQFTFPLSNAEIWSKCSLNFSKVSPTLPPPWCQVRLKEPSGESFGLLRYPLSQTGPPHGLQLLQPCLSSHLPKTSHLPCSFQITRPPNDSCIVLSPGPGRAESCGRQHHLFLILIDSCFLCNAQSYKASGVSLRTPYVLLC
jgi:hypothetical protein